MRYCPATGLLAFLALASTLDASDETLEKRLHQAPLAGEVDQLVFPPPIRLPPPDGAPSWPVDRAPKENQFWAIAPWARPAYGAKYGGYYVGGGKTPTRLESGRPPRRQEGTWGLDYMPWYSRVRLLWSQGRLYQGGRGQYEPDRTNWPLGQHAGRHLRDQRR